MFKTRYEKITDEKLVKGICNGDQKAFSELYARYKDRLYYYFLRMLNHSPDQANDFLQDLFMKLIQQPELFDRSRKFSTWIYTIASNMCKNEYRRVAVRQKVHADVSYTQDLIQENDATDKDILLRKLFAELDSLGNDHREVFLLHYREGFKIREISEIVDLAPGTIKSRLHYARKHLEQRLKKYHYLLESEN